MSLKIEKCGNFVDLPLPADTLVEAGWQNERILRATVRHNRRSWVLWLLLVGGSVLGR
jgi:hypothetical protein